MSKTAFPCGLQEWLVADPDPPLASSACSLFHFISHDALFLAPEDRGQYFRRERELSQVSCPLASQHIRYTHDNVPFQQLEHEYDSTTNIHEGSLLGGFLPSPSECFLAGSFFPAPSCHCSHDCEMPTPLDSEFKADGIHVFSPYPIFHTAADMANQVMYPRGSWWSSPCPSPTMASLSSGIEAHSSPVEPPIPFTHRTDHHDTNYSSDHNFGIPTISSVPFEAHSAADLAHFSTYPRGAWWSPPPPPTMASLSSGIEAHSSPVEPPPL